MKLNREDLGQHSNQALILWTAKLLVMHPFPCPASSPNCLSAEAGCLCFGGWGDILGSREV